MPNWFNFQTRERVPASDAGLNPAWWLQHRSLARSNRRNQYLLANEWIASNLAWFLRLPVPPFALMRASNTGERFFASLDYGGKDTVPEDFLAEPFARHMPRDATGVVLFDILIANSDRHAGNLAVDSPTLPTQFELIDHDYSLFGHRANDGQRRLSSLIGTNQLALGGTNEIVRVLATSEYFEEWIQRIESIPDQFIDSICHEALELGISNGESDAATTYLKDRKRRLREVIAANRTQFRAIQHWSLFLSP